MAMMSMKTDGSEEISRVLTELGEKAEEVAGTALFDGAAVVADAFTNAIGQIQTEPFRYKKPFRKPSPEEVAAIRGKTGIARFRKNGSEVNTIIGLQPKAGYVMLGKRKTAVEEIARSINSGTSFMAKQPVFRKAASSSRKPATEAIIRTAEKKLKEITKE